MADKFRTIELKVSRCKLCDFPIDLPASQDPFYKRVRELMANGLITSEYTTECRYHTSGNMFVFNVVCAFNVPIENEEPPKETDGGLEPA